LDSTLQPGKGLEFLLTLTLGQRSRPHIPFLTVLYKMGLLGFPPLLALLVYFSGFVSSVHCNSENHRIPSCKH